MTNIEIEGDKSAQEAMEGDGETTPRAQAQVASEQEDVPMQDENIAMMARGAIQQIK